MEFPNNQMYLRENHERYYVMGLKEVFSFDYLVIYTHMLLFVLSKCNLIEEQLMFSDYRLLSLLDLRS